jgi:hypothetical protein
VPSCFARQPSLMLLVTANRSPLTESDYCLVEEWRRKK